MGHALLTQLHAVVDASDLSSKARDEIHRQIRGASYGMGHASMYKDTE